MFDSLPWRIGAAACCLVPCAWFLLWPKGWRSADRFDQILYILMVAVVTPWAIAGILFDALPNLVTGLGGFLAAAILITFAIRSIRWSRRTQREMTALIATMHAARERADAEAAAATAAIDAHLHRHGHAEPTD